MDLFSFLIGKTENSQLTEAIKAGAFLVDVRTPNEFSQGSVKVAVNIPLDKIRDQLSKFSGKNPIVVFCRSGHRSSQAKRILESRGIRTVINGGSWQNVNKVVKSLS